MAVPSSASLPRLPLLPLLFPLLLLLLLPLDAQDASHRCNGHGTYKNNGRCECWALNSRENTYWLGATCTMKQCPQGKAWADIATATDTAHALGVECSGQGTCDRNEGTCVCEEGFEGIACSRMTCPNGCSGHGTCKSMRRNARDNPRSWTTEKLMQYYYTAVWDAEMIYGCHCDREFHGYDCSLRICPNGDDPLTTGQVNEKQTITCQGFHSFQIGYDNFLSRPIEATGTTEDVRSGEEWGEGRRGGREEGKGGKGGLTRKLARAAGGGSPYLLPHTRVAVCHRRVSIRIPAGNGLRGSLLPTTGNGRPYIFLS